MSESSNPLTNFPGGTVMGMSFTPDGDSRPTPTGEESVPPASEQVPVPAEIPAIVRVVWEIDAHAEPLTDLQTGQLFTLHKTGDAAQMLTGHAPDELVNAMRDTAESDPESLTALPFQLPNDDGLDFLKQLGRVVWSDEIEGVAVLYETNAMLTAADMADAPADPQERQAYLEKKTAGQERSRFVVAATRTEAWSVVHPRFDTDPEHIEQGPALVADLLQLITNGINGDSNTAS
ncbi:hypothetical protein [Mobiluncus curtisii]|uniref:hypothetical protein n=1 Tax=Mobiluncus curtisii TaxID=2051 RepID=UPI00201645F8|nr:hypothetical protein [Mobiluncus curtisii]